MALRCGSREKLLLLDDVVDTDRPVDFHVDKTVACFVHWSGGRG